MTDPTKCARSGIGDQTSRITDRLLRHERQDSRRSDDEDILTPIQEVLNTIRSRLDQLEDIIDRLRTRLKPILREADPSEESPAMPKDGKESATTLILIDYLARVIRAHEAVSEILGRLDI